MRCFALRRRKIPNHHLNDEVLQVPHCVHPQLCLQEGVGQHLGALSQADLQEAGGGED